MDDTKQGILLVHFGTSHDEARARTMDVLEQEVKRTYPGAAVRTAFTSHKVREILRERGVLYPDVPQALSWFADQGILRTTIRVSLLVDGHEYRKVKTQAASCARQFHFLGLSQPLLHTQSLQQVADALTSIYPAKDKQLTLFMGHGKHAARDSVYRELEVTLRKTGYDARIVTLKDRESPQDLLAALPSPSDTRILLVPLLYVAGRHIQKDMLEGEGSWRSILTQEGYPVQTCTAGLGEYASIRKLYIHATVSAI